MTPADHPRSAGWSVESRRLMDQINGPVAFPDQPDFADSQTAFDLAVPQQPALVVGATEANDIVAGVRLAHAEGLGVGVQATGHGITVPADGGLLINTHRAARVDVDPSTRTARLDAGATWSSVISAASPFGLAPLCGAAPGVGAVAYTLGGGLGPLGRPFGFAADHVRRLDMVTADGELRRASADEHPDLFWGVRGGGGNFGVVTSVEIDLMPVAELYAGGLFFPGDLAGEVLPAFLECTIDAPNELSLSVMVLAFPDSPALPPALRHQHCCHVRVAYTGLPAAGESLIRPLRALGEPLIDTVRVMPFSEVGSIHNDPTVPHPVHSRSLVTRSADPDMIAVVLEHLGPDALSVVELRHLGGALAESPSLANAVGHRGGVMNVFTSAYPIPSQFPAADAQQLELLDGLTPWSDGGALFNFLAGDHVTPADVRGAFDPEDFTRLTALKAAWDPSNLFRFNQNIPPAEHGLQG